MSSWRAIFHQEDDGKLQAIIEQFWRRWLREYVPTLTERRKWFRPERNIRTGDVVIIVDDNSPRGKWPLGRVVRVMPGPDGIIRTAAVKTSTGEYTRPVAKLCLLELNEDDVFADRENRAGDVASGSTTRV